ncbi:MAG: hypothetical protein WCL04_04920 [Verrucomicrobiota bacterium]
MRPPNYTRLPVHGNVPRQPADAYRRRQGWLAAILAVQLIGGLAVLATPGQEEFPLYSWFLFALTPEPVRTRTELRLLEWEGQPPGEPRSLATYHEFVAPSQAPTVVRLARDLGQACAEKDEAAVQRLRRTLEENFIRQPARYELVELSYSPIARLHGGTEQVRKVREFKTGAP